MQRQPRSYRFTLHLNPDEMTGYYQGTAREVCVQADNGQRLRFAARHLRPFMSTRGIHGQFLLTTDENDRFKSLHKVS